MRSSVSYILSSAVSEPSMSYPDYEQIAHDHAALLVLANYASNDRLFAHVHERLSRVNRLEITDSCGNARTIRVRYVKDYPGENNDWGDFQTHRRLLGLITFAKYDTQNELDEACCAHERFKSKYMTTLYDNRCFFFGPVSFTDTPKRRTREQDENQMNAKVVNDVACADENEKDANAFTLPSNFQSGAFFYKATDARLEKFEERLVAFVQTLFTLLEAKRMERARVKLDNVQLMLAPFEKKDFVGLDLASKTNKKRCMGRVTKNLGDLSLQSGLISESLTYYHAAVDTLKAVNDWLWLGAAYEGLCAASVVVLYPNATRVLRSQFSWTNVKASTYGNETNSDERNVSGKETRAIERKDVLVPVLSPDDMFKYYNEAIIHYSKYQSAAIIETEACFKAARMSILQNRRLQTSNFLKNVMQINLKQNEHQKILQFETLANVYQQIHFQRKASFCLRLAATRYVSLNNPEPNAWCCYQLMYHCLDAHRIDMTRASNVDAHTGWPVLQIQLLQELIVAARKLENRALAVQHMTFLVESMWRHLTGTERRDFAAQLDNLAAQCEGSPVSLVLESPNFDGDATITIPPANLTNVPACQMFVVRNLRADLQPRKIERVKKTSGPFLYTPFNFGGTLQRVGKEQSAIDFPWVEGDMCEVTLKLHNPLPFDVTVSNMQLLTSGPVWESIPATIRIAADAHVTVSLNGIPKSSGEMDITGYSTHTLGVKSHCYLAHMRDVQLPAFYRVQIIPALPNLTLQHDGNEHKPVTSLSIALYHGQTKDHAFLLVNNSSTVPIEMLEPTLDSNLPPDIVQETIKWTHVTQTIAENDHADFRLTVTGVASFICPLDDSVAASEDVAGTSTYSGNPLGSVTTGPSSLPSGPASGSFSERSFRRKDPLSSFRSSHSGQSSLTTATLTGARSPAPASFPATPSLIDARLQFRYSGGSGMTAGYCRVTSLDVTVELMPSVQITHWDVLPAETNSQFYLVLDVANVTSHEMALQYTPVKHIQIESGESCRVPVPLERCPLTKLAHLYTCHESFDYDEMSRICAEHVAQSIHLAWSLVNTNIHGSASLNGLTLTDTMLDLVRVSPLEFDVTINDEPMRGQETITCQMGSAVVLGVTLTNHLPCPITSLQLQVQIHQDYENGSIYSCLDTRVAVAGLQTMVFDVIEARESVFHECTLLFFHTGVFKVELVCTSEHWGSHSAIDNKLTKGHIWRLVPPISVNVEI